MATIDVMTFDLSADTKRAMWAVRLLRPFVALRLMPVDWVVWIAVRLVKVTITPTIR